MAHSARSPLSAALPVGLAGLVLGATAGYLLAPDRGAAGLDPGDDPGPDRGRNEVAEAHASPATLAAAPQAPDADVAERASDEAAASRDERQAVVPGTEPGADGTGGPLPDGPLLEELTELLRSSRIERELALANENGSERGASELLTEIYLRLEDPEAALSVVERTEGAPHEAWSRVAEALHGADMDGRASHAWVQALELLPAELSWDGHVSHYVMRLAQVDPGLAAYYAELRAAGHEPLEPNHELALAQLLAQAGRGEEALARAMSMLDRDVYSSQALEILVDQNPELAEAEILRRKGEGQDDDSLDRQHLKLLLANNRTEDAMALLEERAAAGEQSAELIVMALESLPASQVEARLDAWLEACSDRVDAHHGLGQYFARTDPQRAFGYYESGWEAALDDGHGWLRAIPDEVLQNDPSRAMDMLTAGAARAGDNDELWGDLGDHYWRLGEHQMAEDAWRRAAEIDPDDSEWSSNLEDIATGDTPVGSVRVAGHGFPQNVMSSPGMLQSLGYISAGNYVIDSSF